MRKIGIFIGIVAVFFIILPSFSQAKQGISVTPSVAYIDLATDKPEYLLTYTNNTKTNITLSLSVSDFNELEEGYAINFLSPKDASNYKYSLSSWISFETKSLELLPGEQKSVKISVDKQRITKGGHYASIQAEVVQTDNKEKVNLRGIISALLFVRASTGKEIEDGSINTFKSIQNSIEYPDTYLLRLENSGNVHVIPYGIIQVYDPLGNLIAKGILNEGSLDALPESIRRYDTKVTTYQKVLLPGFYTAKISLHFGKTDKKLSASTKFFSQGSLDFVKIAIFALILVGAFIFLKRRKNLKENRS